IGVGHLVDLRAQLPLPPHALARAVGADDSNHRFDWSVRHIESHKQHASDLRQLRFGEARSDQRKTHAKLAERLAVTSRCRRLRGFPALHLAVDERYSSWEVYIIAWRTPAIPCRPAGVCGCPPVSSLRVEGLEHQATVVTEQFMHADHPQEEDGIIVIALDPFTFASWTLHAVHSNRLRELIVRDILAVPCAAKSKIISSIQHQARQPNVRPSSV